MKSKVSLYDSDSYYGGDAAASRLSPALNALLLWLDLRRAKAVARRLAGTSAKVPAKVLDVGAGDGKFLYGLQRLGFYPFGTTASQIAQGAAKKRLGINLHFATDLPPELTTQRYQLITYWHVFEHLEHPESHVKYWRRMLTEGGMVIVEVPNIEGLGARFCFRSWLGSDLKHHINHQKSAHIVAMAARYGLQLVRSQGFSLKFTYPFLWSALLGAVFGKDYSFDRIFGVLKSPTQSFRKLPWLTINALLAVGYLSPAIVILACVGLGLRRGEVLRLYFQTDTAAAGG